MSKPPPQTPELEAPRAKFPVRICGYIEDPASRSLSVMVMEECGRAWTYIFPSARRDRLVIGNHVSPEMLAEWGGELVCRAYAPYYFQGLDPAKIGSDRTAFYAPVPLTNYPPPAGMFFVVGLLQNPESGALEVTAVDHEQRVSAYALPMASAVAESMPLGLLFAEADFLKWGARKLNAPKSELLVVWPARWPIEDRALSLLRSWCYEFVEGDTREQDRCKMRNTREDRCRCEQQRDALVEAGVLKPDA